MTKKAHTSSKPYYSKRVERTVAGKRAEGGGEKLSPLRLIRPSYTSSASPVFGPVYIELLCQKSIVTRIRVTRFIIAVNLLTAI